MSAASLPLAIGTGVNGLALVVFAVVLSVTLVITFWAARRTSTATEFWAAGRSISGLQNGFAMAGDYLSASTFLGFAGLTFLIGVDADRAHTGRTQVVGVGRQARPCIPHTAPELPTHDTRRRRPRGHRGGGGPRRAASRSRA
jgi:hypothetical protein